MITDLRFFNGKLQYRATYQPGWFDVRSFDVPTVEETKKEEKLNFIMDQQVAQATQNMKFCVNCNQEIPKPEVKRKKLAEIARSAFYSYESAPENPVDTFNRVASAVLADLEKRIDSYIGYQTDTEICVMAKTALKDFIRKEWLGE